MSLLSRLDSTTTNLSTRRFEANKAESESVREEQRTDGGERVARLVAAEHPAVVLIVLQVDALRAQHVTALHVTSLTSLPTLVRIGPNRIPRLRVNGTILYCELVRGDRKASAFVQTRASSTRRARGAEAEREHTFQSEKSFQNSMNSGIPILPFELNCTAQTIKVLCACTY